MSHPQKKVKKTKCEFCGKSISLELYMAHLERDLTSAKINVQIYQDLEGRIRKLINSIPQ